MQKYYYSILLLVIAVNLTVPNLSIKLYHSYVYMEKKYRIYTG